ncbi:MAG: hypothetical protein WCZ19_05585 [Acholeplasma sp.]
MSILKLIQEAEEKAEKLKDEAKEEIAALLEKTKEETATEVEKLFNDFTLEQKNIDQEYNDLINKKEKDIIETYLQSDLLDEEKAKSNSSKTVDFIMGKVIET